MTRRCLAFFVKAHGIEAEFDQWRADTKAVATLRQNKGPEWIAYEKSLAAYATDLNQYGTLRDIIVRRADRHLRFLFEVGAIALGHTSIIRNPARLVSDGIAAWLRIVGGNDLVQRHRTVVGCPGGSQGPCRRHPCAGAGERQDQDRPIMNHGP